MVGYIPKKYYNKKKKILGEKPMIDFFLEYKLRNLFAKIRL